MSRKVLIPILIVVVAAAVTIGVLAARAQGSATLPAVTPSQLLADVATKVARHQVDQRRRGVDQRPARRHLRPEPGWRDDADRDRVAPAGRQGSHLAPGRQGASRVAGPGRRPRRDGGQRLRLDLLLRREHGDSVRVPADAQGTTSPTPLPSASVVRPDRLGSSRRCRSSLPRRSMAVTGQESVAGQQSYILDADAHGVEHDVRLGAGGHRRHDLRAAAHRGLRQGRQLRRRSAAGFTSVSYASIDDDAVPVHAPVGRQGRAQDAHAPLRARGADRCAGAVGAGEQVGGRGEAAHPRRRRRARAGFDAGRAERSRRYPSPARP